MGDFVQNNWSTILSALVALACPLMHAFGHRGSRHHHEQPGRKPRP
jgi:hypothetical protein